MKEGKIERKKRKNKEEKKVENSASSNWNFFKLLLSKFKFYNCD
jgi:hypothetical protein